MAIAETNGTCRNIPPGEKCEFKAYHETLKHGISSTETTEDPFNKGAYHDEDSAFALVIRRKFQENKPDKTTLQVNSPHILKAFREIIKSYLAVPSDFTSTVELHTPFEMLVHYWYELHDYRQSQTDTVVQEHMDLLLKFMDHEIGPDFERAHNMIQKQQISYDNAWVIFRPGDIMYSEMGGHSWLSVCQKTAYEQNMDLGPYLEVHCSYTDDNGMVVGQATHVVNMNQRVKFPAGKPVSITDLYIYPRKFIKEGESLERRIRRRGEKFLALMNNSTVAYDGPAEWLKEPPFDFYDPSQTKFRGVWLPYTENGRVVLDRKTFGEEQPLGTARVKRMDPEPLFCPPYTLGFSLGRKQWCRFFVDCINDVEWKAKAWDSLILPDKEKHLLQALISSHTYSRKPRDFMQQKGKGLVVLLHGTPGSGKTLTAETAAEGTRKALVSTSVGELSKGGSFISGSASFEKELKKLLQYATVWQAVVLLDEADVFLESRKDIGSTERNSLVAVFLKELEYFGGIVFLTTNRVNSFDIAMKSRVHLSLSYTPPEREARQRIWFHCLTNAHTDASEIDVDKTIGLLVKHVLNGREIANAVNTARTLARFDGVPLRLSHLKTVLDVRQGFDESLRNGNSL
ncbi:P-loop containing nucleoside triphosphate hydrolase protein [Annulohypoxylon maeteangense]|uniref:P-loop containing nucleoside triphosphate hydrolase protein n=1 Tax=Annulohypoxylon maeteangense TaxID=1927788 RepID=UPI0020087827|nr:P-loop containing nucleoside triphosphate hydrolase protein [Annulohypoxylon maeteangense]KAI0889748.1 P-loop containing nucleoside triphosphate hydrolase protein [Annulohypoxylon maeteangense]